MSYIQQPSSTLRKSGGQSSCGSSYAMNTGSNPGGYMAAYAQNADNYGPVLVGNGGGGISPYGASPIDGRYLSVYGGQQVDQGVNNNGFDITRPGNGNSGGGNAIHGYYPGMNSTTSIISAPNTYGTVVGVPYGFQGYMPFQGVTYAATPDAYGNSRTIPLQHLQPESNNGILSMSTPGAPIQTTKELQGPDGCNLFVFHIPNDMTNNDLYSLFSEYGEVISARIMVDKATGRSRGFGFVSFNDRISAEDAIKGMNGCHIGHKRLKVQHKKEKDKLDHATPTHLMRRNSSNNGSPVPIPYFRHAFVGTEQTSVTVAANNEATMVASTSSSSLLADNITTDSLADRLQSKLNLNASVNEINIRSNTPVENYGTCEKSAIETQELNKGSSCYPVEHMRAPVASVEETLSGERNSNTDEVDNAILQYSPWKQGSKNETPLVAEANRS